MKLALVAVGLIACTEDGGNRHVPDAQVVDVVSMCPPPSGTGTMHPGTVSVAETWTAAASPHVIPSDMSINAKVTIEPCAIVKIGPDKSISVNATGSIEAKGEVGREIVFDRQDPTNSWSKLRAQMPGALTFEHVRIRGGGDRLNTVIELAAAVELVGQNAAAEPTMHAVDVTIEGSESNGLFIRTGGGFDATSTDLRITGSALYPITVYSRLVGTVPPGTYTGNARDKIMLPATSGPEAIVEDTTMHDRGVPYHIGYQPNATLDVRDLAGVAVLTIEPGVTLEFEPTATLRIDPATSVNPARGALVAVGTPQKPITFTSSVATPAAGDWYGIWFGGVADPATKLDYAIVKYAGHASASGSDSCVPVGQVGPNDAAIRILGSGEPAGQFITNTTITDSARHGIDRGFRSDTKPDFLPTNTFTNVARCKQTYPRDISGACPTTIPCP